MLSYKEKHELFVSNHEGTSPLEIAFVVSSAPLSVWLRNLVVSWLFSSVKSHHTTWMLVIDFVILVLPVLSCVTFMSDHLDVVLSMLIFASFGIMTCCHKVSSMMNHSAEFHGQLPMTGKRPFITYFRAYVNIATAICILGVDFAVFPRRFAKAETYGSGLMDVGVGAFVISNAIVSPEARGKQARNISECIQNIKKACISTLPLFVLGFLRFATVKATDYHEHVSEYGVHWNFFFTLAVVKVLSTLVLCVLPATYSWLLSIGVALGYQTVLSAGLHEYILLGSDGNGGRHGLLDANREGIFSSLGYLAIYFVGVQLGSLLMKPRHTVRAWLSTAGLLALLNALAWLALTTSTTYVQPVSRRMANLPYVVWMVVYNVQLLLCFLLVDLIMVVSQASGLQLKMPILKTCLLEAVNCNGLFYFLLANLMTGLVNFSMRTIYSGDLLAVVTLCLYMFTLSFATMYLHKNNIKLKIW